MIGEPGSFQGDVHMVLGVPGAEDVPRGLG